MSGSTPGRSALDRCRRLAPEQFLALDDMIAAVEWVVGVPNLSLIWDRVDLLLGSHSAPPEMRSELMTLEPAWREAVVTFVDQFVMNVSGVDDAIVDDLVRLAGAAMTHGIVNAAWIAEASARAGLVLDQVLATEMA